SYAPHLAPHSFPTRRSSDLFLVAAFGLLDAVIQPTVVRQLWLIRYGIITPYTAVLFALTFVPGARRWVEWALAGMVLVAGGGILDRKSTRLNSSHVSISYAV